MKKRDFFISWLIGTALFIFGRTNGFNFFEILFMCALAGVIQGAVTGYVRTRK